MTKQFKIRDTNIHEMIFEVSSKEDEELLRQAAAKGVYSSIPFHWFVSSEIVGHESEIEELEEKE
jgi:hypothetical protein